jgi:NAD(P)-dependent dehydrogenase (short-subunit alcohol dehydrogenase family)
MSNKVAFITGASRGIGAESAAALAKEGYDVAIVARTLADGEVHDHIGSLAPLPGSLEATAAVVNVLGQEALCLRGDILDEASMINAAKKTLKHFGHIDLLFNNAVYQGTGNQETLMDVTKEQIQAIYQGNIFTPLALIKTILPAMEQRKSGTVINMLSATAFLNPPATAANGGWGFAYPSSKAAFGRMSGALRVEHADVGLRIFNLEPGTVITEVMKASGIDKEILNFFRPCTPAAIASVVAWLAENEPLEEWNPTDVLRGPAIAKILGLLKAPSLLGT